MSRKDLIEDIYPLSPTQQGMLFHSLYAPRGGQYFEQLSVHPARGVRRRPSSSARGRRWCGATRRSARSSCGRRWTTRCNWSTGGCGCPGGRRTGGTCRADRRRERFEQLLRADQAEGFDVSRPPLMRFALLRVEERAWRFVWSHHHLLLDGWSLPLVLREVLRLYGGLLRGETVALPAAVPYRTYVEWLLGRDRQEAERFWRETLAGVSGRTDPPLWGSRGPRPERASRRRPGLCPPRTRRRSAALAPAAPADGRDPGPGGVGGAPGALRGRGRRGLRPDGVGAAGRSSPASSRWWVCSSTRCRSGSPSRRRRRGALADRSPAAPGRSPGPRPRGARRRPALERGPRRHAAVRDHRGGGELPRRRGPGRRLPGDEDDAGQEGGALVVEDPRTEERTHYPVTVSAVPGERLRLSLSWDRARLADEAARRMLDHLAVLLGGIARAGGDAGVGELPMLTLAEHRLLRRWNPPERESAGAGARSTGSWPRHARRDPGRVAVVDGDRRMTYGELDAAADRVAGGAARCRGDGRGPGRPAARALGRGGGGGARHAAGGARLRPARPGLRRAPPVADARRRTRRGCW